MDDFSKWKRSRVDGVVDLSGGGTDAGSFLEMRWGPQDEKVPYHYSG